VNVVTKEQSKQWMHTHSSNKPKKFKQALSARKLMATVSCDRTGVLMVGFMQQGTTTLSQVYCQMLKESCVGLDILNKRRIMLTSGVVLIHDNVHPRTVACT
jgi:hypothetical protein